MRSFGLLALFLLLLAFAFSTHARPCGGTLVVRRTDGQLFAVVVPKSGDPISARSFGIRMDCNGPFTIDSGSLICLNNSRLGFGRYNFIDGQTDHFENDFNTVAFSVDSSAALSYNANTSLLCATKGISAQGILFAACGTLVDGKWKITTTGPVISNTVASFSGFNDDPSTLFHLQVASNGTRATFINDSQVANVLVPSLSNVSQIALSGRGNTLWHLQSNPPRFYICESDNMTTLGGNCYNATLFSNSSSAATASLVKLMTSATISTLNLSPEDSCSSIIAYWTNMLDMAPLPITFHQPSSPPTTPRTDSLPIENPSTHSKRGAANSINRAHLVTNDDDLSLNLAPTARSPATVVTSTPIARNPVMAAPDELSPFFMPPIAPPSTLPGRLNLAQVDFIDCPSANSLPDPPPNCSVGETIFRGQVAAMAWTDVELQNLNYTSTSSNCPLPAPSSNFVCVDGIWISHTDVNTTTIVATGTVTVYGNFSVTDSVVISGYQSSIAITGCFNISGTIIVELSDEDLDAINKKTGTFKTERFSTLLISPSCPFVNTSSMNILVRKTGKNKCAKVSMDAQTDSEYTTLSGLFKIDRTGCNLWWIILVSVLGGVVILAVIALVLLFTFNKRARTLVRPFSAKRAGDTAKVS